MMVASFLEFFRIKRELEHHLGSREKIPGENRQDHYPVDIVESRSFARSIFSALSTLSCPVWHVFRGKSAEIGDQAAASTSYAIRRDRLDKF